MKMLGTVELLWLMLTLTVSSVSIIACIQPNWVINPFTLDTYGLLTLCRRMDVTPSTNWPPLKSNVRSCNFHDSEFLYLVFPSLTWNLCVVIYTVSCVFMFVSAFVGVFGALFLDRNTREKIAVAASFTQGLAIMLSAVTVAIFPAVFGSVQSKEICGESSSAYYLGNCQLGWSYMLAIAGTAIGAFCPYLAQHIDVFLEGVDNEELLNQEPSIQVRRTDSFKSTSTFSSFISV